MLNLVSSAFNQIRSDRTLKNKETEPTQCQRLPVHYLPEW